MPTILTEKYLAGLVKEATVKIVQPTNEAFEKALRDIDTLKAGIAIQDRAGRLSAKNLDLLDRRLSKAETKAIYADTAAFERYQQATEAQQAFVAEVKKALNEMKAAQKELKQTGTRNKDMLGAVLAKLAQLENRSG